jgi:hypothetical protein
MKIEKPSTNLRDQFVRKVVMLDRLPTHWELCQLAAMTGNNVPPDHSSASTEEAERRVTLAMYIWRAAGRELIKEQENWKSIGQSFDQKIRFYQPLKVGNHFLPRVTEWKTNDSSDDDSSESKIAFTDFLEMVIGLSKEEDRMKWWREYLTAKVKSDKDNTRSRSHEHIKEREKQHSECCESDDFTFPKDCIPASIEKMKKNGVNPDFEFSYYLEGFRSWRLTMKTPNEKAALPYKLEECQKKGLEAEAAANS